MFNTALRWDGAAKGTRITLPTCTPSSCARVNDANTWSGSDCSGIRPDTSLTMCVSCFGGTSKTLKSSTLIGREQAQVGVPDVGSPTRVDVATTGSVATLGIGLRA